jgi:hypothetical protein
MGHVPQVCTCLGSMPPARSENDIVRGVRLQQFPHEALP